jgi:hypothetical protein
VDTPLVENAETSASNAYYYFVTFRQAADYIEIFGMAGSSLFLVLF